MSDDGHRRMLPTPESIHPADLQRRAGLSRRALAAAVAAGALALSVSPRLGVEGSPVRGADGGATLPEAFTPVTVRPLAPTTAPVLGDDGRYHLAYDLLLTNAKAAPALVSRLEIVNAADPTRVLVVLEGEALRSVVRELSLRPTDATLAPGFSKLIFVNVVIEDPGRIPAAIAHRLIGAGAANPGATEATPFSYLTTPISLVSSRPPVIESPLRGDRWVAVNGPGQTTGAHRSSVQSVNGSLYNAQRFAIDWVSLDDQGRFVTGDQSVLTNWRCYGEPIHAVADGLVVSALNTLPDQLPGRPPETASLSLETVDGNHIVQEIGGGLYAFYAHMIPGSVNYKAGDRVKAGDVLGRLGNSGSSSAPHLHLHIMDSPSVLGSDGVPYVLRAFTLTGGIDPIRWEETEGLEGIWPTNGQSVRAGEYRAALPQNLHVITWPAG